MYALLNDLLKGFGSRFERVLGRFSDGFGTSQPLLDGLLALFLAIFKPKRAQETSKRAQEAPRRAQELDFGGSWEGFGKDLGGFGRVLERF